MQLFCLTYAGGTAAFYNQLDSYIDSAIELIKLEYAGHGMRHREAFYNNFFELAEDMYNCIKENLKYEQEYALIGYSMGSISVVEILNLIIKKKEIRLPRCVFLAAHEPLPKPELAGFVDNIPDEMVKERTIRFGGIPERLINNRSFWRMYLPLYRNDYSIIGKYKFDSVTLKTDIPAVIFYSPTDTKTEDMILWNKYFVGKLDMIKYDGNHFFIEKHCAEMCKIINNKLQMEDKRK